MSREPTVGEVSRNAYLVWQVLPVDGAGEARNRIAQRNSTPTRRREPLSLQQCSEAITELATRGFAERVGKFGARRVE